MGVILQFNTYESMSFDELQISTQMSEAVLKTTLLVRMRPPRLPHQKHIRDHICFSFRGCCPVLMTRAVVGEDEGAPDGCEGGRVHQRHKGYRKQGIQEVRIAYSLSLSLSSCAHPCLCSIFQALCSDAIDSKRNRVNINVPIREQEQKQTDDTMNAIEEVPCSDFADFTVD
jgi:hypothetical protein